MVGTFNKSVPVAWPLNQQAESTVAAWSFFGTTGGCWLSRSVDLIPISGMCKK